MEKPTVTIIAETQICWLLPLWQRLFSCTNTIGGHGFFPWHDYLYGQRKYRNCQVPFTFSSIAQMNVVWGCELPFFAHIIWWIQRQEWHARRNAVNDGNQLHALRRHRSAANSAFGRWQSGKSGKSRSTAGRWSYVPAQGYIRRAGAGTAAGTWRIVVVAGRTDVRHERIWSGTIDAWQRQDTCGADHIHHSVTWRRSGDGAWLRVWCNRLHRQACECDHPASQDLVISGIRPQQATAATCLRYAGLFQGLLWIDPECGRRGRAGHHSRWQDQFRESRRVADAALRIGWSDRQMGQCLLSKRRRRSRQLAIDSFLSMLAFLNRMPHGWWLVRSTGWQQSAGVVLLLSGRRRAGRCGAGIPGHHDSPAARRAIASTGDYRSCDRAEQSQRFQGCIAHESGAGQAQQEMRRADVHRSGLLQAGQRYAGARYWRSFAAGGRSPSEG